MTRVSRHKARDAHVRRTTTHDSPHDHDVVKGRVIPDGARSAIVFRAWEGFDWDDDDVQNLRKMQEDLSDLTDGDGRPAFDVTILMHIHNVSLFNTNTSEQIIRNLVPNEFASMTHLWTYNDTQGAYPLVGDHEVYYHMFMALQLFSQRNAQYKMLWNWEMDVRYTGRHDFFQKTGQWADKQLADDTWHQNQRFHVPCPERPFHDSAALSVCHDLNEEYIDDAHATSTDIRSPEETDLITLLPLFDVAGTMWPYRDHTYNYDLRPSWLSPRLASVGTNVRLSKRLLQIMHEENVAGRSMVSEMWPATAAHHAGLKIVYAPHPMYFEQQWSAEQLETTFNAGANGRVGGSLDTVVNQEKNFRGSTWYWTTEFGPQLYHRWMGLAHEGPGSSVWEEEHGLMCLPAMLLHPIKKSALRKTTSTDAG
ncbi:hypothetical protein LTR78_006164 [Recurvomyces mirabilis]|uniref:Uncharacterized protein n=1 Tax=Recurvomyces mirabilis TaxID=574656 RepID=A0AAE0WLL0_9PEZI|nr:hypothetical protein LTR78_006164 [Recurvomyces mirabilis]KAK5152006.1 hypothetical protein LTS14_008780 [Recurvomyces mirabilis]